MMKAVLAGRKRGRSRVAHKERGTGAGRGAAKERASHAERGKGGPRQRPEARVLGGGPRLRRGWRPWLSCRSASQGVDPGGPSEGQGKNTAPTAARLRRCSNRLSRRRFRPGARRSCRYTPSGPDREHDGRAGARMSQRLALISRFIPCRFQTLHMDLTVTAKDYGTCVDASRCTITGVSGSRCHVLDQGRLPNQLRGFLPSDALLRLEGQTLADRAGVNTPREARMGGDFHGATMSPTSRNCVGRNLGPVKWDHTRQGKVGPRWRTSPVTCGEWTQSKFCNDRRPLWGGGQRGVRDRGGCWQSDDERDSGELPWRAHARPIRTWQPSGSDVSRI